MADDLSGIFIFQFILFNFTLQSTAAQITFNLQKIMIFSVSNDRIQWILDFDSDSVTIAVIDLDQILTISSQKIPLAAWQLLLSQRQDDLLMEGSVEKPIVLDEEEDKENAPPPPSTPESVRPVEPPKLQRSCAFGARIENAPN